jgi:pimeloyl-ACP methyl ester carboxylesterase
MTHGWPGSIIEFLDVIGPLTDPRSHGGDARDAFHLVCPSLPGYGYTEKPAEMGWGVERTARAWATVMARLGYDRYVAQGGDWGALVTASLGRQDPDHVVGIHLNMPIASPPPGHADDRSEEPDVWAARRTYERTGDGYAKQQSTFPQTIGYGLVDSPAAQCAWIVEKFHAWTDHDGDIYQLLTRDQLLDNVMLYWLPGTGASSARMYWESFRHPDLSQVAVPTGVSVFRGEIYRVPRSWCERRFTDLRCWRTVPRGGHFAAFEQPALFVEEVRAFFDQLREIPARATYGG